MPAFLSTTYAWQWQILALHIHACIGSAYVIAEMYAHMYKHIFSREMAMLCIYLRDHTCIYLCTVREWIYTLAVLHISNLPYANKPVSLNLNSSKHALFLSSGQGFTQDLCAKFSSAHISTRESKSRLHIFPFTLQKGELLLQPKSNVKLPLRLKTPVNKRINCLLLITIDR